MRILAIASVVAVVTSGSASADLQTTINATNAPSTGNFGTITISGGGSTVTITVTMAAGLGFDTFGFNYSGPGTISSYTGTGTGAGGTDTWTRPSNEGSGFDGWGKFQHELDGNTNGAANKDTTATFTISGSGLTLTGFNTLSDNNTAYFALHLVPLNGSTTLQAAATNAATPVPTPEPSTVALAILGAIGFVGYGVRQRWKKSEIH
jgi:hypothetical protein